MSLLLVFVMSSTCDVLTAGLMVVASGTSDLHNNIMTSATIVVSLLTRWEDLEHAFEQTKGNHRRIRVIVMIISRS